MKNALKWLGCLAILLTIASFISAQDPIVGRWQRIQKSPNGDINLIFIFRADSTYDGIVNGKAFTNGRYFIKNDTISVSDNGCNLAYYGTYKLKYYAQDSLLFTAISDTCQERYQGANGLACKKLPKK
ncbi:hypothetical protein MUK70_04115 [Dyadobacter chenwenxiniae]|uniref:DUF2147 domain-containing protein n=1 Tax=Dyadobacter chenwenxiniae TaxID=2906456 RepID=A0A9X1TNP8_9BACT|nr:hypothetical protein [Dyadobacter chenwenxiniae]MCF0064768.1 hypothetical protein [Dyadobacter chenwenxiniae]UON84177.1 hypothetical protein MUK70_04115 [Dyadobacter chenwenxiniae]